MARKIDFTGPSVRELGIKVEEIGKAKNGNVENSDAFIGNTKNGIASNGNTKNDISKYGNAENGISKNANAEGKRIYNSLHFKSVRNYLYAALGDSDRAEIKLSVMGEELGINPKTLYKHLKTLRETEFVLTKLQYATEVRKRQGRN